MRRAVESVEAKDGTLMLVDEHGELCFLCPLWRVSAERQDCENLQARRRDSRMGFAKPYAPRLLRYEDRPAFCPHHSWIIPNSFASVGSDHRARYGFSA